MAYYTENRAIIATLSDRYAAFKSDLADRYTRFRVYRDTLNELSDLTDRELADLGLARGMIRRVAMEAAYKD